MEHYDCIMQQEVLDIVSHVKLTHKCRGVKKYRSCISPLIKKHCSVAAVDEFDRSVHQFGCLIH
uniref:Uncharacterized protein n=1 Tax=Heterorhabditis bacteriophora TaxID=37862 RepID=A0A1I7XI42_HETBA